MLAPTMLLLLAQPGPLATDPEVRWPIGQGSAPPPALPSTALALWLSGRWATWSGIEIRRQDWAVELRLVVDPGALLAEATPPATPPEEVERRLRCLRLARSAEVGRERRDRALWGALGCGAPPGRS